MRRIKRFEELDFNDYVPEETRYKEVENIVKDILIDLDEYPTIEWSLEELKSRYFPNVFVPNVANLSIGSSERKPGGILYPKTNMEWKPIIERMISQLNAEGFVVFEHSSKNIESSKNIIGDNWLIDSFGYYYKIFKICLSKSHADTHPHYYG